MADRKPSPYWLLRKAAEDDQRLSFQARHLFNKVLSMRASKAADVDEVFPLPWSMVSRWLNRKKDRTCDCLNELEAKGYLYRVSVSGCPPTRRVRLLPPFSKGGEKSTFKGGGKPPFKGGQKDAFKGGQKSPHHISKSLQTRKSIRGRKRPGQEGEGNRPDSAAAPSAGRRLSRSESARALREWREKEFGP